MRESIHITIIPLTTQHHVSSRRASTQRGRLLPCERAPLTSWAVEVDSAREAGRELVVSARLERADRPARGARQVRHDLLLEGVHARNAVPGDVVGRRLVLHHMVAVRRLTPFWFHDGLSRRARPERGLRGGCSHRADGRSCLFRRWQRTRNWAPSRRSCCPACGQCDARLLEGTHGPLRAT